MCNCKNRAARNPKEKTVDMFVCWFFRRKAGGTWALPRHRENLSQILHYSSWTGIFGSYIPKWLIGRLSDSHRNPLLQCLGLSAEPECPGQSITLQHQPHSCFPPWMLPGILIKLGFSYGQGQPYHPTVRISLLRSYYPNGKHNLGS